MNVTFVINMTRIQCYWEWGFRLRLFTCARDRNDVVECFANFFTRLGLKDAHGDGHLERDAIAFKQ